jgi:hypothetical protein
LIRIGFSLDQQILNRVEKAKESCDFFFLFVGNIQIPNRIRQCAIDARLWIHLSDNLTACTCNGVRMIAWIWSSVGERDLMLTDKQIAEKKEKLAVNQSLNFTHRG